MELGLKLELGLESVLRLEWRVKLELGLEIMLEELILQESSGQFLVVSILGQRGSILAATWTLLK